MAEAKQYTFTYKEVAEALIRKENIKEGLWGVYLEFGMKGANVGQTETELFPAVIVPVLRIGIQRFDQPNALTVDAAEIWKEREPVKKRARKDKRS